MRLKHSSKLAAVDIVFCNHRGVETWDYCHDPKNEDYHKEDSLSDTYQHHWFDCVAGTLDSIAHSIELFKDSPFCAFLDDLSAHDWSYQYSDDGSVWRAGMYENSRLQKLAEENGQEWQEAFKYFQKKAGL